MRRLLLLGLMLSVLAAPVLAAPKERDFAVGAKQVLGFEPQLPDDKQTSKTLKDILARPEFNDKQAQPKGPSLADRIWQWILTHLIPIGVGTAAAGGIVVLVAAIVIAAILVLLVYVIVRAVWGRLSREPDAPDTVAEENLTSAGFRELAKKSAAAGAYQAALRYRFRSVVGELDVLDAERQTNWQLLRHVRKLHAPATGDFAALVGLFEDCWYGGRKAGAEEYYHADALATAVEKALTPREAAA